MTEKILTDEEVVRSYRDAEFRESLTSEQLQFAANHPLRPDDYIANEELSDEDLDAVAGGLRIITISISSGSCCSGCSAN